MKKNIFLVFFLAAAASWFSACKKDFLNQVPDDRLVIDSVFRHRNTLEQYLANVYNTVLDESTPWYNQNAPWLGIADECDFTWARSGYGTYFMNLGSWDPNSGYYNLWTRYYQGIRSATYFIEHADECREMLEIPGGRELLTRYKAESRFLRAFYYFCLLKQYGPVILLKGDSVIAPDVPLDQLQLSRSPFDECVEYISAELDKAAAVLPLTYADVDLGRPTKGVCLAVKSRMLLYAASPLYNGNTDYAGFKNPDGTPLINQTYDADKWQKAAAAARAVIDLNIYHLYQAYDEEGKPDPLLSCRNLFLEPWNAEWIFARDANAAGTWEQHCSPRFAGGWSGVGPTQQIVDAFFMDNGKAISEPGSGYVEDGFSGTATKYTRAGIWNMYVHREPRFYADITYNGKIWMNHTEGDQVVETFFYGNTGKNGSYDYSRTGYLVAKNYNPDTYPKRGKYVPRPWVLFRLGEIYLNYAEALNEYDPGNPDILKYVNLIRERAGIPGITAGLSQEEMRQRIRHERQVELAFEGLRYFDTRRWKIAIDTDGGPMWGMDVDAGTSMTDPSFYKRTVFETRIFEKKHYLFPIPQSEMDRNTNLAQNPGW